jgi:hypothetical protein
MTQSFGLAACVEQMTDPAFASCGTDGSGTQILGDYKCNAGYYKTESAPYCARMAFLNKNWMDAFP